MPLTFLASKPSYQFLTDLLTLNLILTHPTIGHCIDLLMSLPERL